jgi:hypothetical protein
MCYSVKPNNSGGPGWYVVNADGKTVCWVYEQPYGGPDKKRAGAIARMLNNNLTGRAEQDCSVEGVVGKPVLGYGPNAVRGVNGGISCKVCGLSIHSCGGFHPNAQDNRQSEAESD